MKRTHRAILIAAGLFVASASVAEAGLLSIPLMIPDICFGHLCKQYTQTTALATIQNTIAQARNLLKIPAMTPSGIQQYIDQVTQAGHTVNPLTVGDVAASTVVVNAQTQAQIAAKASADAQSATGALQAADATNEQLGALNATAQAQLDLAAQQQKQSAAERALLLAKMQTSSSTTPLTEY